MDSSCSLLLFLLFHATGLLHDQNCASAPGLPLAPTALPQVAPFAWPEQFFNLDTHSFKGNCGENNAPQQEHLNLSTSGPGLVSTPGEGLKDTSSKHKPWACFTLSPFSPLSPCPYLRNRPSTIHLFFL